jgi:hypothetical protein
MTQINEVSMALGRIEAKLEVLDKAINSQQIITADLTAMKNKAIGVLVGISLLAGAIGAAVKTALLKLFGGP